MRPERVIGVDIGSTYTKGALFEFEGRSLRAVRRASHPTTQDDLSRGFGLVAAELLGVCWDGRLDALDRGVPIRFSSSAKGGLRVAALGIVPDLTLQAARLASWSAGSRIVGTSSYRLTRETLEELLLGRPDIILLTGGTDGGNERFVLGNAGLIAESSFEGTVIYAGNSAAAGDVARILARKTFVAAENILPEIGTMRIEPAREAIRRIFLDTIIRGKGLDAVRKFCGADPKPTPLGVFDLVRAIGELYPEWKDFCVIDLGGATTDFYSSGEAFRAEDGVVLRGLKEPAVKRTVEGDLGLRVSAESLFLTARAWLEKETPREGPDFAALESWVDRIRRDPELLPGNAVEEACDALLAAACSYFSAFRHAGFFQESWTPVGKIFLQSGKDLRHYGRIVGTGGYLSRTVIPASFFRAFGEAAPSADGRIPLLPRKFRYFRDSSYLFPLLGNLVEDWPDETAACALAGLEESEHGSALADRRMEQA